MVTSQTYKGDGDTRFATGAGICTLWLIRLPCVWLVIGTEIAVLALMLLWRSGSGRWKFIAHHKQADAARAQSGKQACQASATISLRT